MFPQRPIHLPLGYSGHSLHCQQEDPLPFLSAASSARGPSEAYGLGTIPIEPQCYIRNARDEASRCTCVDRV